MQITNRGNGLFFVDTGDVTSDSLPIADICELRDSVLVTHYAGKGIIHVVPPIRVKLGALSLARITELAIGDTFKF